MKIYTLILLLTTSVLFILIKLPTRTYTHICIQKDLLTCECMAKQHISLMKRKFAKTFRYEFFLSFLIITLIIISLSLNLGLYNILSLRYVNEKIRYSCIYVMEAKCWRRSTAYFFWIKIIFLLTLNFFFLHLFMIFIFLRLYFLINAIFSFVRHWMRIVSFFIICEIHRMR